MESQALVGQQRSGSHGVPIVRGSKRFRTLSSVDSVGKQLWQFRVEKKVTLRPPRISSGNGVRAKTSGFQFPGTQKLKKGEESGKEDDSASETPTKQFKKLPGTLKVSGQVSPKDDKVVFVAGATGKVGRRVVRELVQQGYSVRAGVRNLDKAQFLVNFAAGIEESPAAEDQDEEKPKKEPEQKSPSLWSFFSGNLFGSAKKKTEAGVELVEFDLGGDSDVEAALGNASVVVCAIGASEKEVLNVSAPYQVDYKATVKLIDAATQAKVKHFVLVTSLGTTKAGWPAVVLNLFWGVLIWKAKAEKAIMESGIPFTIVRPGGMERPTDAYKETHNVLLDKADSRFGGQVSNLQVAELIGGIVSNLELAQNKVLEIVAETTAPLRTFEDLLAEIPSISDINEDKEASNDLETEEEKEKTTKQGGLKGAKQRAEEEKLSKREEARAAKQRAEEEKQARSDEERARKQRQEEERLAKQEQVAAEKAAEKEKFEGLRQKLQDQYRDAKESEEEAQREADEAILNKADIEKRVAELRAKVEAAAQAARESKALEVAVVAAARERKTLSEQEKSEVVASVRQEIAREAKEKEAQEKAAQQAKETQELKAKAEAEQKRKGEEAKAKAEAESAAKAEADKEAKAEAAKQAKARAEAEKKAKVEAELKEKAKVEAEMKAKKDAEEKAKVEAETKAKKEAEVKAKEAEEKAKNEAEEIAKAATEKAKAETEIKAKQVADEKKKVEADIKAKAEAATKAVQEKGVEIKAKSSGFRWPWQKDVEEEKPTQEKPTQTKSTEFPPSPTSLSPYKLYDGMKPPTSPTPPKPAEAAEVQEEPMPPSPSKPTEAVKVQEEPTPPTPSKPAEAVKVQEEPSPPTPSKPVEAVKVQEKAPSPSSNGYVDLRPTKSSPEPSVEDTKVAAAQFTAEVAAREQDALQKAKEATKATFLWPWQKEVDPEPSAPTEPSSTPTQPLSSTDLPKSSTPLSPYARYPDMKPPTSPTPSAPTVDSKIDSNAEQQPEKVLESASTGFRWPWQ